MIRALLAFALVLSTAASAAPAFDYLGFFTGRTRGDGTLKILLRAKVPVHVESRGQPDGKGGIVIHQTIREGDKKPRDRQWVLRQTSPTSLTGTMSDGPGPVAGRLVNGRLLLSYAMDGGLKAEQVLVPQPDGRTIHNSMTVRRFGIAVAHVEETIRKLD